MKCDHDHSVAKVVLGPPSRKISPLGRSLVRIYRRNVLSMYRAVRAWLHLMIDAEDYGALHQWVLGEEPILESLTEYEAWTPTTRLAKALFDVRVEQTADRFRKAGQVTSFAAVTSTLVDWDCVRMAGDRRMGTQHLRIFGEAMGKIAQIARIETSFDVVNTRAVKWASENTNRVINELVKDQIAGVGEYVSRGIAEGDSMATIGRQMRRDKLFGLNQRQMRAMRGFREKVTARYSRLKGGLTGRHGPSRLRKIERAVQREATKKLRYRAEMIARTETARAVSEGTLEAYKVGGVDKIQFEASADACIVCIGYDGHIYPRATGEGLIPVHPNCRCNWLPVIDLEGATPTPVTAPSPEAVTEGLKLPPFRMHSNKKGAEKLGQQIVDTASVDGAQVTYPVGADGEPVLRSGANRQYIGKVDYSGLDVEAANLINRKLLGWAKDADRLGLPRLRGVVSEPLGGFAAQMGDGVLHVEPSILNRVVGTARLQSQVGGHRATRLEIKAALKKLKKEAASNPALGRTEAYKEIVRGKLEYLKQVDGQAATDFQAIRPKWTPAKAGRQFGQFPPIRPNIVGQYFRGDGMAQLNSLLDHEFGHHIHHMIRLPGKDLAFSYRAPPIEEAAARLGSAVLEGRFVPTRYGLANHKEWFAENYSLYVNGRADLVQKEAKAIFKKLGLKPGRTNAWRNERWFGTRDVSQTETLLKRRAEAIIEVEG